MKTLKFKLRHLYSIAFRGAWYFGWDAKVWRSIDKPEPGEGWTLGPIHYCTTWYDGEIRTLWLGPFYIHNHH